MLEILNRLLLNPYLLDTPTKKGYKCFDPKKEKYVCHNVFQIEDMDTNIFQSALPISQTSKIDTLMLIENDHSSLPEPTPAICKKHGEPKPTFSDKNNELIEMPLNDESSEKDRLNVRNNI